MRHTRVTGSIRRGKALEIVPVDSYMTSFIAYSYLQNLTKRRRRRHVVVGELNN